MYSLLLQGNFKKGQVIRRVSIDNNVMTNQRMVLKKTDVLMYIYVYTELYTVTNRCPTKVMQIIKLYIIYRKSKCDVDPLRIIVTYTYYMK